MAASRRLACASAGRHWAHERGCPSISRRATLSVPPASRAPGARCGRPTLARPGGRYSCVARARARALRTNRTPEGVGEGVVFAELFRVGAQLGDGDAEGVGVGDAEAGQALARPRAGVLAKPAEDVIDGGAARGALARGCGAARSARRGLLPA